MKNCTLLSKRAPAVAALFTGVLVLVTGCVGDRVTYVQPTPAYPVPVEAPEPPPAPVVDLPPAPPPAPVAPVRSQADLDRMLAPIALYPDPLMAQLLPAATLPAQVVMADRYVREGGNLDEVDAQPWDNSLKALARYPATLRMLDDNLAWTTDLGQAFVYQPSDVMDSVQRLRAQARAMGNLFSTPQQTVLVNDGYIQIVPATPQVIYVPVYQPEVVYVQRPPSPDRFYISFGAGLTIGAWLNHDCDWHSHEVIVWHHDHPRPADWWYSPPSRRETPAVVNNVTVINNNTTINNTTIVNRNVTVWHPTARGGVAGGGDRGWGQPAGRTTAVVKNEPARSVRGETTLPKEVHPSPPGREVRPDQREVQQPPAARPETRPSSPREEVRSAPVVPPATVPPPRTTTPAVPPRAVRAVSPPTQLPPPRTPTPSEPPIARTHIPERPQPSNDRQAPTHEVAPRPNQPVSAPKDTRPVQPAAVASNPRPGTPTAAPRPVAPNRPPSGALAGIESSRVTRESSARGQQSREAMAKPAAGARPAQAPAPAAKPNSAREKKQQNGREN